MVQRGVVADPDAIVIGSGPNGLAAAIVIAQAGRSVAVYEAEETIGGGARSAELTLPGFVHDVCSSVFPFAVASPFFRTLPLARYGLEWVEPPAALAHPFDDAPAAVIERSLARTAAGLGEDEAAYTNLMRPVAEDWPRLEEAVLGPVRVPRHPFALARFGLNALRPAAALARRAFRGRRARGAFAGLAAHGMLPLERAPTAGFGLVLGAMAHVVGWPLARGGAQAVSNALASYLRSLGGEILAGRRVRSLQDLPGARAVLCDLSPRPLLKIAGHLFPPEYRRRLELYRYGLGAFKVDWALNGPIPWRDPECARAGTVHLGGTLEEIAAAEREAWAGLQPERPFVLLVQASLFDPTRAPEGMHTAWGYCHVPNGSAFDMLGRMEQQIERFAPGFRDRILARSVMPPAEIERHNANLVGGDIAAGSFELSQAFTRPTRSLYSTPVKGLYICSSSTPPGVGVHGMCGYFAAQRALKQVLG
jgi:phytoene dehydrogenase-like protein